MLNRVMPGARMRRMVAIRFSPPSTDDQPITNTPRKNIWMPIGPRTESGG